MINKVEDFSYKSWVHYTNSNDCLFKNKNLIFGYNGKGKSSLVEGLIQEFNKNNGNEKQIRIFDKNFLKLQIEFFDEEIKGVKGIPLAFGEKNVKAESKIKQLNEKIKNNKEKLTEISKEQADLEKKINDKINNIFTQKKGTSDARNVYKRCSFDEINKKCNDDLEKAKKLEDEDILKDFVGDSRYEDRISEIESINYLNINQFQEDNIDSYASCLSKDYEDLAIPAYDVIKWLDKGVELHEGATKCKFCGGEINVDDISKKVQQYLNDAYNRDSEALNQLKSSLENTDSDIDILISNRNYLKSVFGDKILFLYGQTDKLKLKLKKIIGYIDQKIKDKHYMVSSKETLQDIYDIVDDLNTKIRNVKKNELDACRSSIDSINILVRGAFSYTIINDELLQSQIKKYRCNFQALQLLDNEIRDAESDISAERAKENDYSSFAVYFNKTLEQIGIEFKLVPHKKIFILEHLFKKEVLDIEDISEGEKNLFALLFFYYELLKNDNPVEVKDGIKLIIMDDPISSLDDLYRIFVLTLLVQILHLKTQVFITTHIWEDCYYLIRPFRNKIKFLETKKRNGQSYLIKGSQKDSPYKHDFNELIEFIKEKEEDTVDESDVYIYPNMLRRVLEEFLNFKIGRTLATAKNSEKIMKVLGISCEDNEDVTLKAALNVCNAYSHSYTCNPSEIYKSVDYIMKKIKEIDPLHYNFMIGEN